MAKTSSKSVSTRITRSKHTLELAKKSEISRNLSLKPTVKKLDKKLVDIKFSPRITRSSAPVKQIPKNSSPRATVKTLNKEINPAKLSPRRLRSREKKPPIAVPPVAPAVGPTKLKQQIAKPVVCVKLSKFKVNDIVLAKQKYSCPWPSRILRVQKEKVFVYFFGDKRSGFVDSTEIYSFCESFVGLKSLLVQKQPINFYTGVREVELLLGLNGVHSVFHTL